MTDLVMLLQRTERLERLVPEVAFHPMATLPEDIDVEWSGWDVVKYRGHSFVVVRSTEARGWWFITTQPFPAQPFIVALATPELDHQINGGPHVEPR